MSIVAPHKLVSKTGHGSSKRDKVVYSVFCPTLSVYIIIILNIKELLMFINVH